MSILFHAQPGVAWRRHISAIAAYMSVKPPNSESRCMRHGKGTPAHWY